MDRAEKKRRVHEWARDQRAAARAELPLADHHLKALFDYVNEHVEIEGCDHSRRFTEGWLATNAITAKPVLGWLAENGGYCDCEVIANAEEAWESVRAPSGESDA